MFYRVPIIALLLYFAAVVCSAAQRSPAGIRDSEQDEVSLGTDFGTSTATATVTVAELQVPAKARKELEKARKAVHRHRLGQADQYVAKALLAWPHYCQALTLKSWLALRRQSYEQARVDAEMAVQYNPNDYLALMTLADSYMFLNRLDDALHAIDRSMELKPNAWQGYYEKGKLSILRGNWPGALRATEKAFSLTTENAYLHLLRIFAFAGMKDQSAADREMAAFRRLKPEAFWSPELKSAFNGIGYHTDLPTDVPRGNNAAATHP